MKRMLKNVLFAIAFISLWIGQPLRIYLDSLYVPIVTTDSYITHTFMLEPIYSYDGVNWEKQDSVEWCTDFLKSGRLLIRNEFGDSLYVLVEFGDVTYSMNSREDEYVMIVPLTMGSGKYEVTIGEYMSEDTYVPLCNVILELDEFDEINAYLGPSYFDYFDENSDVVKISELIHESNKEDVISAIQQYVVDNMFYYDDGTCSSEMAALSADEILSKGYGVCLDYARLTSCLCRSLGIPCKTVWGYVGDCYHAWNEYYDGKDWIRMDTTWMDGGASMQDILDDSSHVDYKYF